MKIRYTLMFFMLLGSFMISAQEDVSKKSKKDTHKKELIGKPLSNDNKTKIIIEEESDPSRSKSKITGRQALMEADKEWKKNNQKKQNRSKIERKNEVNKKLKPLNLENKIDESGSKKS